MHVERVFSIARMVLSYQRNRLKVQTVRALMCVGEWIREGLLKDKDLLACLRELEDVDEENEEDVEEGWDRIDH